MLNKKLKVILRSEKDNKKLVKIKFSKEETIFLNAVSTVYGMTIEEIIRSSINLAISDNNLKNSI
jgi:hypothetical protein